MNSLRPFAPRLLAGFGTLALLASIGLFASRPAHTAGGPVPVAVTNAVQERDSPPRQPVEVNFLLSSTGGQDIFKTMYTVPAGKRLVVEYVTARSFIPSDGNSYSLSFQGGEGRAFFSVLPDGSPFSSGTQKTLVYVEAGNPFFVSINSNGVNFTNIDVAFSGYLVDVP